MKREDLTNKRFGNLVVITYSHFDKISRGAYWKCICDCGNYQTTTSGNLKSGRIKSCGCGMRKLQKSFGIRKKFGESSFNGLYYVYKYDAEKRNLCFELSKDEFRKLTQQNCYYCGIEPKQIKKASVKCYGDFVYNGIDRLDNNKGYILENCVSCCKICNIGKSNKSLGEFYDWIKRVYEYKR